ncbi:manganese-dependent inorganic pyrophosphatase [Jeotgalibacillus sp. R-1-5s-1]|uniref:manganese-dependent inorganic pyrophosphatase n=1 Tax=Jeotgalibacillus sp. R-1-5s-1 TaxID=2555897 RepID=UPI00106C022A|nr:manganese-dependent inorganic pyrophosphatase [Jeotgalibacillus sp. R-1-5s-1]TFD98401.1 manganese-dependent inorganic pyrophosphatase [Jeotgalibacillus sp. R-1-5s-1]
MSKVLVFGHKNPDTDTITSAIAYAYLKQQLGMDAEAVRLGEINGETAYALETFKTEQPRLISKASEETGQVILVDHNERQQSVEDINDVQVLEVIDHHRIANFETSDPVYFRAEPVGCTATILLKLYKENGVEIPKEIAGLMLSAIISDSLLFKSPTCTEQDRKAAEELQSIAGVNTEEYGLEMLKAGADLSGKTADELVSLDAKVFEMGGHDVEIAQVNAIDPNDILSRQAEIEEAMDRAVVDKNLSLSIVAVTDILNSDSTIIVRGAHASKAEKAFNVTLSNGTALLAGVVSRKKQIVPVLTETFNEEA